MVKFYVETVILRRVIINKVNSKVTLVYRDIEENIAEETIWAKPLENGLYQIDNIPFYAPNLSNKDIIAVENDEGVLYFDDLIEASGHSTVQIIFFDDSKSKSLLKNLEEIGCKWEGMKEQPYYTLDIPSNVNYKTVKDILDKETEANILDYKEACLSEIHS